MPAAIPAERESERVQAESPNELAASATASDATRHADAPEEPALEELDAGFDALLEEADH
jgi:hypothetical protein